MDKPQHPVPPQTLKVEIGEREAEGIYANVTLITHSPSEFVLDFARLLPGAAKTRVQARVIMAPRNVKKLLVALSDNIRRYEEQWGAIQDEDGASSQHIGFTPR
jgi:hypothetical protein